MSPHKNGQQNNSNNKKKRKKKLRFHEIYSDDSWSDNDINQGIANASGMEVEGATPNNVNNFSKKKKTYSREDFLLPKTKVSSPKGIKSDSNNTNAISFSHASPPEGGSADLHSPDPLSEGIESGESDNAVAIKVHTISGPKGQIIPSKQPNNIINNPDGITNQSTHFGADLSFDDPTARFVHMMCTNKSVPNDLKKLNPWDVDTELQDLIGTYKTRKILKSGIYLIECESYSQVRILLQIENFLGLPVKVNVAYNIGTVRGVVHDFRASQMPEDVLLDRLKSQGVVQIKPIYVGKGSENKRSEFTILVFRLDELPSKVYFGKEPIDVAPYRPKIYQCTKCWNYGHHPDQCNKLKSCEHCAAKGNEHDSTSCLNLPAKCSLCGKNHKATDRTKCDRFKRERAILNIREEQKVSYKTAEDIFFKLNKNKPNSFRSTSRQNTENANAATNNDNNKILQAQNS